MISLCPWTQKQKKNGVALKRRSKNLSPKDKKRTRSIERQKEETLEETKGREEVLNEILVKVVILFFVELQPHGLRGYNP